MGELPPPSQLHPSQPPSLRQTISAVSNHQPEFWCYHFVESISVPPPHLRDLMDDEIPPLSGEIIQFLGAIDSPDDDRDLPLPDATADV
ncbi:hypothetical protein LXL04_032967 [Taraxacum kok-saghyz]